MDANTGEPIGITYGVYECADGEYTWRHRPCGKDAGGETWASIGEASRAYAKHDAACTNYGFND